MSPVPVRSRAVLGLFFSSGAVGLLYQVVWIRLFVHVFGATVLAVSTVLAAFMGGLALGGLWGGRMAPRLRNPLRAYGLLELGLGLYAGLVPFVLRAIDPLYETVYPGLSGSFWGLSALRFAVSAIILLPPTFLMGATLPVLTAHAERLPLRARQRVAHLYAINTFGAVTGTVGASFVLLPGLGLSRTLVLGVALNLAIAGIALRLARTEEGRVGAAEARDEDTARPEREGPAIPRALILTTAGVLGFAALAFEVLWTRALALALGTTTYAFAIVLTVFLLGIAGGSLWAGRLLRDGRRAPAVFTAAPALIGFLALFLLPIFDRLPGLFVGLAARGGGTWLEGLLAKFVLAGLPMLPPTFLSGAAFPLAVGIDRQSAGPSRSVGDVYASNTLGAIIGSWAAGFVLIPTIGLRTGILFAAALQIFMTCLLLLFRRRAGRPAIRGRPILAASGVALAAVAAIAVLPDWNRSALTRGGFAIAVDLRRFGQTQLAEDRKELVFLEEGITSTITVRRWGDELTMQMNGVTEASNFGDLGTQVLVGGLGGILHANPRDVLVIGLGSGITAAAALRHPGVESVECVEISEAVVHAARLFEEANGGILDDPRCRVIVGDGRNHLGLSGRAYDVIVSQPSNVWNSGIGSLMSSEFFARAADHLKPGGILVSWIQGYSLTPDALRSVMAAVREHLPRCSLWMAGWGDLVIIAGGEDFAFDAARLLEKGKDPVVAEMLRQIDTPDLVTLFTKNVLAGEHFDRYIAGFPPNTDDNLYLEFEAPKLLYRETIAELFESLGEAAGGTEEFLVNAPPGIEAELERARRARILEDRARIAFRENQGERGLRVIERAYRLDPRSRTIADVYALALDGRGQSRARQGDLAGAVEDYLRAAELDPRKGAPFANLSHLHRDAGRLPTALDAIAEALAREPRNPDFIADRATLLVRTRDFEGGLETARQALAVDRRHREAHLAMSEALMSLDRTAEAESVLTAVLRFHPGDEEIERLRRKAGAMGE